MTSYVYIIAMKDEDGKFCSPVKVGMSDSPKARLAQLLTGSHLDMGIVHAFAMPNREIASKIERAFHTVKQDDRKRGEWFDLTPGDALLMMCANIDSAMELHFELSPEEVSQAWQAVGWPYSEPYTADFFRQ